MLELMMQELNRQKWNIYTNQRFILPDWGLLEANKDADMDCNGIDGWFRVVWEGTVGVEGVCSIGASNRWICKM
jgi:hypothetical protein